MTTLILKDEFTVGSNTALNSYTSTGPGATTYSEESASSYTVLSASSEVTRTGTVLFRRLAASIEPVVAEYYSEVEFTLGGLTSSEQAGACVRHNNAGFASSTCYYSNHRGHDGWALVRRVAGSDSARASGLTFNADESITGSTVIRHRLSVRDEGSDVKLRLEIKVGAGAWQTVTNPSGDGWHTETSNQITAAGRPGFALGTLDSTVRIREFEAHYLESQGNPARRAVLMRRRRR
jgi:hypothetical protein